MENGFEKVDYSWKDSGLDIVPVSIKKIVKVLPQQMSLAQTSIVSFQPEDIDKEIHQRITVVNRPYILAPLGRTRYEQCELFIVLFQAL